MIISPSFNTIAQGLGGIEGKQQPAVEVQLTWGRDFGRNRFQFVTDRGVAGTFTLCERRSELNERLLHFRNIERDYSVDTRRGLGLAVYQLFIENYGESFSSETILRPGGLKVWDKLCTLGIASAMCEPTEFTGKDELQYYSADYRASFR